MRARRLCASAIAMLTGGLAATIVAGAQVGISTTVSDQASASAGGATVVSAGGTVTVPSPSAGDLAGLLPQGIAMPTPPGTPSATPTSIPSPGVPAGLLPRDPRALAETLVGTVLRPTVDGAMAAGEGAAHGGTPSGVLQGALEGVSGIAQAGPVGSVLGAATASGGTGTWNDAGAMLQPRTNATFTLLKDGRVLAVGGGAWTLRPDNTWHYADVAETEIYDPRTDTWTSAGSLTTARESHTTTLLADGRVVVIGGAHMDTSFDPLWSAEIFDPATRTWSVTGGMAAPRFAHTAALLHDGRLLVVGGVGQWGQAVASVEIFDPRTGTFSPAVSLHRPRWRSTETVLPDGTVMEIGGTSSDQSPPVALSSVEIYDPAANTWTDGPSMSVARAGHTATLLVPSVLAPLPVGGEVVVTGGDDNYSGARFASTEIYDMLTHLWRRAGDLHFARTDHGATALADGRVIVTGGAGEASSPAPYSAEILDPITGQWHLTSSMGLLHFFPAAIQLPDGRVLVGGGVSARSEVLTL